MRGARCGLPRPPTMCVACPPGVYYAVSVKNLTISGDIVLHAWAPGTRWNALDTCIFHGRCALGIATSVTRQSAGAGADRSSTSLP